MIPQLLPMLAVASEPFDSAEHVFEVKWDGIRALARVEDRHWQLWGRERSDYTGRYPELDFLSSLPTGTVLDGELVVFNAGRTDLAAILSRHGLTSSERIRYASRLNPVTYVVFDLLFMGGQSLCARPLRERRRILAELLARHTQTRLVFSEELSGSGKDFFAAAVAQGHEGIMAKHQGSRYLAGKRSAVWRKIKPRRMVPCVIVGYRAGLRGLQSLLLAAVREGHLQYVGHVSGLSEQVSTELQGLLARRPCSKPFVTCPTKAAWVTPDVYCRVRFLDWTSGGRLRGACFAGLLENIS